MAGLFPWRYASRHRVPFIAGIFAATLLLPSISRAADPVEQLRETLKILTGVSPTEQQKAKKRKELDNLIAELKAIHQLRRAYFLKEWSKENDLPLKRAEIGERFTKALRKAGDDPDPVQQLALARLIGEIADLDQPEKKEKFARGLTDVVRKLAAVKDEPIRQTALSALGKITADPAVAIPILKDTLKKSEVGPRRVAAYALNDVLKNIQYLNRAEALTALDLVVSAAASTLIDDDETVRGYCLLAIQESGKALAEQFTVTEVLEGKLPKDLQKVLRTYQAVNPPLMKALADPKINVRLTALDALDQINLARAKIIRTLDDSAVKKEDDRGKILKSFDAPDPLGPIIDKDLKTIARLLTEDDERFRRGAMDFLELLDHQAEPVVAEIYRALGDSDRFVRLSVLRTIKNLPTQKINNDAVRTLASLLRDTDPDLSKAAAEAIEAIGPAASDAVGPLASIIANSEGDARNWDVEIRVAAMKALVAIGGQAARTAAPQVLSALADADVRIRRSAAETIGRLGPLDDAEVTRRTTTALKNALRDDDAEVRLNASEAILSIAATRKKL